MKHFSSILLLLLPFSLWAQNNFTEEQFLWYVSNNHPVVVQANLLVQQGESTVTIARGAFDPKLKGNLDQKEYDGKKYYSVANGGLEVPTWFGANVKAGIDQNTGQFLNDENLTPSNGLIYAGISIPLAQGLLIDKRRSTLLQAKNFAEASKAEQKLTLNNLLFDATKQYWKWVSAYNQHLVYIEAVALAQERFKGVKQSFVFGDKPAIDTLESFIQVQNRQIKKNEAWLKYQITTFELSNYLWLENNVPLDITEKLTPPNIINTSINPILQNDSLTALLNSIEDSHPELQMYALKTENYEIDLRLKKDLLKPKLNLNYNALTEPINGDLTSNFSSQNYKWGAEFSFPIFLRKERGTVQLAKIKLQDLQLGQEQKLLEIKNKVRGYFAQQQLLQKQLVLYNETTSNYFRLMNAEKQKFNLGESSLFIINSREKNLLDVRLKLIELNSEYHIAHTGLYWATGKLSSM